MAQVETKKLDSGDPFPEMELKLTDGSSLTIPGEIDESWLVLLVYRGHW